MIRVSGSACPGDAEPSANANRSSGLSSLAAFMTDSCAGYLRRVYLTTPHTDERPFPELTPRERDVLELIAGGMSNAAIAARFGLAISTVSNHISSIFAKLQVATRAEAIVRARDAGL